jgi:hypothetical protein
MSMSTRRGPTSSQTTNASAKAWAKVLRMVDLSVRSVVAIIERRWLKGGCSVGLSGTLVRFRWPA